MRLNVLQNITVVYLVFALMVIYFRSGWTQYIDKTYGFYLNYPTKYKVSVHKGFNWNYSSPYISWYTGKPCGGAHGGMSEDSIELDAVPEEYHNSQMKYQQEHNPNYPGPPDKTFLIAGRAVPVYLRGQQFSNSFLTLGPIEHNKIYYGFHYRPANCPNKEYNSKEDLDRFYKMLETFKFTS